MTQREQVGTIATAIRSAIAVHELARDEALAQLLRFMPEHEALAVVQFFDDADAGNSPATDTVESILGRPSLAFGVWAADLARAVTASVPERSQDLVAMSGNRGAAWDRAGSAPVPSSSARSPWLGSIRR